jgi:hypothetical protein
MPYLGDVDYDAHASRVEAATRMNLTTKQCKGDKMEQKSDSKIHGFALVLGSIAMVGMMAFHPTGRDLYSDHFASGMKWVHLVALTNAWLLLFGFVGLSRWLGFVRADVIAAACAYLLGIMAATTPIAISAFLMPLLESQLVAAKAAADAGKLASLMSLFSFCGMLIEAFASVFVVTISAAMLFWSIAMLRTQRFSKWLGITGVLTASALIITLLAGHLRMNVHGFGAAMFATAIWNIGAAISMIRRVDG